MARGRMVNSSICENKEVDKLSCDLSRLGFTWLITFADCEGRMTGDPVVLASKLFPRRREVTTEMVEEYLHEWNKADLIYWYEIDDEKYIWFPKFEENQPGLRKEREAPSKIPEYQKELRINSGDDTELLRTYSGATPDLLPLKRKEVKVKETNNGDSSFDVWYQAYPKHVAKDAAKRAWVSKKSKLPELQVMLDKLEEQKQSKNWIKDGGQYIPLPATYINQGRWNDETPVDIKVLDNTQQVKSSVLTMHEEILQEMAEEAARNAR